MNAISPVCTYGNFVSYKNNNDPTTWTQINIFGLMGHPKKMIRFGTPTMLEQPESVNREQ